MELMIKKGIELGMKTLCFTEHYDPCYPDTPDKLDSLLDERTQAAVGSSSRHVGVSNTNLRLKSLYGSGYGLSFTSVPGQGTEVTVRIPAQEEEEF